MLFKCNYYNQFAVQKINFSLIIFLFLSSVIIYFLTSNLIIPSEDALINFNHAKNLGSRGIFTYGNSSVPIEGSVDLLWILYLSLFSTLGFGEYNIALITTIISFSALIYLYYLKLFEEKLHNKEIIYRLILIYFFIFCNPYIWSGITGFSSIIFSFIFVFLVSIKFTNYSKLFWFISLIFCLLRPDASVWIAGIVLLRYLYFKDSLNSEKKIFFKFFLIPGIIIFFIRWYYFGNFFPLPFYVKSSGIRDFLGIFYLDSIMKSLYVLFPLSIIIMIYYKKLDVKKIFLIFSIPILFYYSMNLDMNIGNRFFSPLYFGLIFFLINKDTKILISFLILTTIITFKFSTETITSILSSKFENHYYVFKDLSKYNGKMLVTEAGKSAYYSNWKVEETWGIANPKYSKNFISYKNLNIQDYDLLMMHCNIDYIFDDIKILNNSRSWENMCRNLSKFLNENQADLQIYLLPYRTKNEKSIYSKIRGEYKKYLKKYLNKSIYLGGTDNCFRYDIFALKKNTKNFNEIEKIFKKNGAIYLEEKLKISNDLICYS